MNRRDLLLLAAGLVAGCRGGKPARPITGSFVGASFDIGHLLRGGTIPAPSNSRRVGVAIIGGGVAGLSAGWRFARKGFSDFEILELEPETGGNARCGENHVTAYPWGAQYVPLPKAETVFVRVLFVELGDMSV